MLKTLIKKFEIIKEFNSIKKQYRISKRHKSCKELENVTCELLQFQNKLLEEKTLTEFIAFEIHSLFSDIDDARLKLLQIDRDVINGYDV